MSPVSNSERQRRFRQLTMKERQLKADALDLFLAAIDAKQSHTVPLPDGRQLKLDHRNGEVVVQMVVDAEMQAAIARARFQLLYEE